MSTPNAPSTPSSPDLLSSSSHRRSSTMGMGMAIGLAVILLLVGLAGGYFLGGYYTKGSSSSGSKVQLTETGSSLLYPLMELWGPNYTASNPNVVVSPASTGSGTGQASAILGKVNIGASDGYLANATADDLLNVPVAISAQLIYYNLPGVSGHLDLNGTVLAMIYEGTITAWNDSRILAAQPVGVQTQLNQLASEKITPIKRSDSSGDTFLFTSLCYMSWSGWTYSYSTGALSGTSWTGATGNSGMVTAIKGQTGAIGYVGISYESSASGLQYAALGDNSTLANGNYSVAASHYILPTTSNISNDANLGLGHLEFSQYQLAVSLILGGSPKGAIDLSLAGGGTNAAAGAPAYPLTNLEYALIKKSPTGTTVTSEALAATVQFLEWAISHGNFASDGSTSTYLAKVNFVPLTPPVLGYDVQELAQVQS